jgi:hypothetical protein
VARAAVVTGSVRHVAANARVNPTTDAAIARALPCSAGTSPDSKRALTSSANRSNSPTVRTTARCPARTTASLVGSASTAKHGRPATNTRSAAHSSRSNPSTGSRSPR